MATTTTTSVAEICAAAQRACSTKSGVARCVGMSDACTPFDTDGKVNACTGSAISLCIGGQRTSFDCAQIGLSCLPATNTQLPHCG